MYILQSHITIGAYEFDFVDEINIESTWKELTQKATISLPAALKFDKGKLKQSIKKGDQVSIKIGYESFDQQEVFKGYVSRVIPSVPVVIECEDEMWQLKQININATAKNETMKDFLSRILPVEVDCFDITVPRFTAINVTGAKLLDAIRTDFGFNSFFRAGKLVVGKPYDASNYKTHIIEFGNNIVNDNLEFAEKDDVKIKVKAISNMASGEKIEVELGDPRGEERTLNFYNLPKSELEKVATAEMEKLNYSGYRGDCEIFGIPYVQHGDAVEIRDPEESDKTGRYFVDGVTTRFGKSGYRQTLKIGPKT